MTIIRWYPTRNSTLKEQLLAELIELREAGKITIWIDEDAEGPHYVITLLEQP